MSDLRQQHAEASAELTERTSALHKQSKELQQVRSSFLYGNNTLKLVRVTRYTHVDDSNLTGTATICSSLQVTLHGCHHQ